MQGGPWHSLAPLSSAASHCPSAEGGLLNEVYEAHSLALTPMAAHLTVSHTCPHLSCTLLVCLLVGFGLSFLCDREQGYSLVPKHICLLSYLVGVWNCLLGNPC